MQNAARRLAMERPASQAQTRPLAMALITAMRRGTRAACIFVRCVGTDSSKDCLRQNVAAGVVTTPWRMQQAAGGRLDSGSGETRYHGLLVSAARGAP